MAAMSGVRIELVPGSAVFSGESSALAPTDSFSADIRSRNTVRPRQTAVLPSGQQAVTPPVFLSPGQQDIDRTRITPAAADHGIPPGCAAGPVNLSDSLFRALTEPAATRQTGAWAARVSKHTGRNRRTVCPRDTCTAFHPPCAGENDIGRHTPECSTRNRPAVDRTLCLSRLRILHSLPE